MSKVCFGLNMLFLQPQLVTGSPSLHSIKTGASPQLWIPSPPFLPMSHSSTFGRKAKVANYSNLPKTLIFWESPQSQANWDKFIIFIKKGGEPNGRGCSFALSLRLSPWSPSFSAEVVFFPFRPQISDFNLLLLIRGDIMTLNHFTDMHGMVRTAASRERLCAWQEHGMSSIQWCPAHPGGTGLRIPPRTQPTHREAPARIQTPVSIWEWGTLPHPHAPQLWELSIPQNSIFFSSNLFGIGKTCFESTIVFTLPANGKQKHQHTFAWKYCLQASTQQASTQKVRERRNKGKWMQIISL